MAGEGTKALVCPNCGGTVNLRGYAHTLNAVCVQCLSVLDTRSPDLRVLQTFQERERVRPLIPLGTRGKLHGDVYEVIGFQTREIVVESTPYEWREYLLLNPYQGFRYLTEYDGHWNDVKPIKGVPEKVHFATKPAVKWLGQTYQHFQTATAETTFVMGEFPWQVRVGEKVMASDYVSPPFMLSAEAGEGEVTWSLGEYTSGERIWQAFGLSGSPPPARGIYANQPSPYAGKVASVWGTWLLLMGVLVTLLLACSVLMQRKVVFRQTYSFTPQRPGETSFVTPVFELTGRASSVEIALDTDLDNAWTYFNLALINEQTGQAYDFAREVGYYHGRDSDGAWTEGSRRDAATLPAVPAGRYYLRVEPEGDANARPPRTVRYGVTVRRDVPANSHFLVAALLLLIPPIVVTLRRGQFEQARWQESDYADGDKEDDDE